MYLITLSKAGKGMLFIILIIAFHMFFTIYMNDHKTRKEAILKRRLLKKITMSKQKQDVGISLSDIFPTKYNYTGVFVLHNITKNTIYVESGKRIMSKIQKQFLGKGNKDLYKDYINHDIFTIYMIQLKGSGFESLNELTEYAKEKYGVYGKKNYKKQ